MKKVLRKSLVTILVLATIMSTLAMFGFASSAAVEDEAAVMSTNDVEDRGFISPTSYDQYYAEDVLSDIDTSTVYEYDLFPVYAGTYIIQTFGAGNSLESVDLELVLPNQAPLSTYQSRYRNRGYGYNQMLYFTVSASETITNYTLRVIPRSQATEARISVTFADGFFTQGTPLQYEHIVACNNGGSVSHSFYNVTNPAKACLYDCTANGTLNIDVEGYGSVYVIDPTLISQPTIRYDLQSEIPISVTAGVKYYIVFGPGYGSGSGSGSGVEVEMPVSITLNFSQQ